MTARQDARPAVLLHLIDERTGLALCADMIPARNVPPGTLRQLCPLCQHYANGGCRP